MNKNLPLITIWSLRLSLASAFLSASVDRFGWWGPPGSPNVAWGAWQPFVNYTAHLLWFLPVTWIGFFAAVATVIEISLGLWLLIGIRLQWAAFASAALLFSFALSMTLADGVKGPLNYSVFTAFAAALAISVLSKPSPQKG
jgi:uncharacterized membrane protein YphA (DoxX/SURF4 family)